MRHRELKVGMYITGKPNNGYAVTSQYATCEVLQVNRLDEKILVKVVNSNRPQDVGTSWFVDYKRFVKENVDMPDNEMPIPFPVGSYVIGNNKNCYGQTRRGIVCRVTNYKYDYNKYYAYDNDDKYQLIYKCKACGKEYVKNENEDAVCDVCKSVRSEEIGFIYDGVRYYYEDEGYENQMKFVF